MRKMSIAMILIFLFLTGCSTVPKLTMETEASYPAALMWNGVLYSPGNTLPIEESSIGSELGKIVKEVRPMPGKDGEINYLYVGNFSLGDKIYSIKGLEISEAIAVMSNGKFYRIDRTRGSLGIVWDDKVYDFVGNYDSEDETGNLGDKIGEIKRVGSDYTNAVNGDITTTGFMGDLSIFQVGGKIHLLKDMDINQAIAVEGRDGKFHRAVYIKRVRK